jgi:predicted dinucleotide-binding enzyme
MKIGVLGTGMVGRAHAGKLAAAGHEVKIGTRNVAGKLAETQTDPMGNRPFSAWLKDHPGVRLASLAEAAVHGEVVINALLGQAAVEALKKIGPALDGKILIDITNPLDFSKGMPPSLFVSNTDSLGEQIQWALPATKVVKSLNTTNAGLQVDPRRLAGGDHHAFVSGNDPAARSRVIELLKEWYGWTNIIVLGDISTARGAEMVIILWTQLWGALKTPLFNYKIVR